MPMAIHSTRPPAPEAGGRVEDGRVGDGRAPHGVVDGIVDGAALEAIQQANAAFLSLVARRADAESGMFGLPPALAARIAALPTVARRAVAACPYTLFNVRFEDAEFWRDVAGACTDDRRGETLAPGGTVGAGAEATFALKAVFLAWHLVRQGELEAPLVLGMTAAVRDAWLALPLAQLDRAAAAALPELRARWGTHPRFWPQLLDAAAGPGGDVAGRVRLLGLQLLATDGFRSCLPRRTALRAVSAGDGATPTRTRRR
jgi:hypothetical protein